MDGPLIMCVATPMTTISGAGVPLMRLSGDSRITRFTPAGVVAFYKVEITKVTQHLIPGSAIGAKK